MRLQEDLLGTKVEKVLLSLIQNKELGATRDVTAPELQEVSPLPVYMNLDVYSGFWCTSHCVVF